MKRKAHEPDESVKEQEKNNAGKRYLNIILVINDVL